MKFPFFAQQSTKDCGLACIKMICDYFGVKVSFETIQNLTPITERGTSLLDLHKTAKLLGFTTEGLKISLEELKQLDLPCILYWGNNHFVVLPPQAFENEQWHIIDPAFGNRTETQQSFIRFWCHEATKQGTALTFRLAKISSENLFSRKQFKGFKLFFHHLTPERKNILILLLLFAVSGIATYLIPLITKEVVDKGIGSRSVTIVVALLVAQLFLFLGNTFADSFRSWILLNVTNKINITVLKDFFIKILRLPYSKLQSYSSGDVQQRIFDHQKVQGFLTSQAAFLFVTLINFIAYFLSLYYFNWKILIITSCFGCVSIFWVARFLSKRRILDHERFKVASENQNNILELINGMQDLKINNCESFGISKWENSQGLLYKVSQKSFKVDQRQQIGSSVISNIENVIVSFVSAYAVISNKMTLGSMMGVSMVAGQLKNSFQQFVFLFRSFQDASISSSRLVEVYDEQEEDDYAQETDENALIPIERIDTFSIGFHYPGGVPVLKDINFSIEKGRTTAIVGNSGCGKTTLLKIILKQYKPTTGSIFLNKDFNLKCYSSSLWRNKIGAVLQDGHIFSDSIVNNIILGKTFDKVRFEKCLRVSNLEEFLPTLVDGENTIVGKNGEMLSSGQRQRLLIARAIYKEPEILMLDEITSFLDSISEEMIMKRLLEEYSLTTKIIISHRWSTVKYADYVVVLENGFIVERGAPYNLLNMKGRLYNLFQGQITTKEMSIV